MTPQVTRFRLSCYLSFTNIVDISGHERITDSSRRYEHAVGVNRENRIGTL